MGVHAKVVRQITLDSALVDITDRDIRILQLLADGAPNKEVAAALSIDFQTVKNFYLPELYIKLRANNRANAIAIAFRKGLIS